MAEFNIDPNTSEVSLANTPENTQAAMMAQYKQFFAGMIPSTNKAETLGAGNIIYGPSPGLNGEKAGNFNSIKALADNTSIKTNFAQADPRNFAKPGSYDASRFGHNFDRYYNHPNFKQLGFMINRDNESLYNKNATWFDDFRRMSSQWMGLAGNAMVDQVTNWGDWNGDGLTKSAAKMEHALAIAQSSKEGIGAWTTNFLANSAYTVGIIGEVLIEELALAGLEGLSGGAATPVVAARTGMNATRVGKSLSALVKGFDKVSDAKTFWGKAGNTFGAVGKGVGTFVNPLTHTFDAVNDMRKGADAYKNISDFTKTVKTFGAFYKDMSHINAAIAESKLEGGFSQNSIANEGIKAFYEKNGRMPEGEEAQLIQDKAVKAGFTTTMLNVPAIYLSNKIVLETAFNGFRPLRKLMSEGVEHNPFYKAVKNKNWKETGANPFSVAAKGLGKSFSLSAVKKIPSKIKDISVAQGLKTVGGKSFRYFNANLMEGLQESYQEIVQSGVEDYMLKEYYSELYQDPYIAAKNGMYASFKKGLDEQFSKQGLDIFLSGFLMGGVVQGPQQFLFQKGQRIGMKVGDYINKTDNYNKYKEQQRKWMESQVEALNDVYKNRTEYARFVDENFKAQKDISAQFSKAEEAGDRNAAENARDESMFSHIYTLLKAGKYDMFVDQLENFKDLSTEEIQEAFPDSDGKDLSSRIGGITAKAKNVKDRYDFIENKIPNPFNPSMIDKEKDPDSYYLEVLAHESMEDAKKHAVFAHFAFDRALQRIESLTAHATANNPIGASAASDFSLLYSSNQAIDMEINQLKKEIKLLSSTSGAEEKKEVRRKTTKLESLQELHASRTEYKRLGMLIEKASKGDNKAKEELKAKADAISKATNVNILDENGKPVDLTSDDIPYDIKADLFYKEFLRDSYVRYLKLISQQKNVYPILDAINNSFDDFVDYIKLDNEAFSYSDVINNLSNPQAIYNLASKILNAKKFVEEQVQDHRKKALEKYNQFKDQDKFFQELMDIGVFFNPEEIDEFVKNNKLPEIFFEAAPPFNPITKENPKYQEVIDLIDEYEQTTGRTFSGKPVAIRKTEPQKETTETAAKETTKVEDTDANKGITLGDYDNLPEDIKNQLIELYQKSGSKADIQEWIKESPEAAIIIGRAKKKQPEPERAKAVRTVTKEEVKTWVPITSTNRKSFAEATPALQPLYTPKFVLSPDESAYYPEENIGDSEMKHERVTSLKPPMDKDKVNPETLKLSQERGVLMDEILRIFSMPDETGISSKDVLLNNIVNKDKGLANTVATIELQEFISSINDLASVKTHLKKKADGKFVKGDPYVVRFTDGFIQDFSKILVDLALEFKDFTWHGNTPAVHGIINNKRYAGSIDLLLEKDGQFYIIDLKTSGSNRRVRNEIYNDDSIQVNAYADLFEQVTGKKIAGVGTINIVVQTKNDGKTVVSAQLDTIAKEENGKTVFDIVNWIPRQSVEEVLDNKKTEKKESEIENLKELLELVSTKKLTKTLGARLSEVVPTDELNKVYSEKGVKLLEQLQKEQVIDASTTEKEIDIILRKELYKIILQEKIKALEKEIPQPSTPPVSTVEETQSTVSDKSQPEISEKEMPPENLQGKIIFAAPGTVDPKIFDMYEVINADNVYKSIAVEMGIIDSSVPANMAAKTAREKASKEEQEKLTKEFVARLRKLANSNATVITQNAVMGTPFNSDIFSLPFPENAIHLDANPKNSVTRFNEILEKSSYLNKLYEEGVEGYTPLTVMDLLLGQKPTSSMINKIQEATEAEELMNYLKLYFTLKTSKPEALIKMFYNTKGNLVSESEVVKLIETKLKSLLNEAELDVYLEKVKEFFNPEKPDKQMSEEEKESAAEAIDESKDFEKDSKRTKELFDEAAKQSSTSLRNKLKNKAGC